jgi:hypothetical protein
MDHPRRKWCDLSRPTPLPEREYTHAAPIKIERPERYYYSRAGLVTLRKAVDEEVGVGDRADVVLSQLHRGAKIFSGEWRPDFWETAAHIFRLRSSHSHFTLDASSTRLSLCYTRDVAGSCRREHRCRKCGQLRGCKYPTTLLGDCDQN